MTRHWLGDVVRGLRSTWARESKRQPLGGGCRQDAGRQELSVGSSREMLKGSFVSIGVLAVALSFGCNGSGGNGTGSSLTASSTAQPPSAPATAPPATVA